MKRYDFISDLIKDSKELVGLKIKVEMLKKEVKKQESPNFDFSFIDTKKIKDIFDWRDDMPSSDVSEEKIRFEEVDE